MFTLEKLDDYGFTGQLKIGDAPKIRTPINFATQNDLLYLNKSRNKRFIQQSHVDMFNNIGVFVIHFGLYELQSIKKMKGRMNKADEINDKLHKQMPQKETIVHFEFKGEVKSLKPYITPLMKLQTQLKTPVIQIPNSYNEREYPKLIEIATNFWKKIQDDRPLMGLACKVKDLKELYGKQKEIKCIGLNIKQDTIGSRLLNANNQLITERMKTDGKDVWVHAFGTPRTYGIFSKESTFDILVNSFGVDTLSYHVKPFRKFKPKDEPKSIKLKKYFLPKSYDTPNYLHLESKYGSEYEMKNFCDGPICKKHSIGDMTVDKSLELQMSRTHDIISTRDQSHQLQKAIRSNKTLDFVTEKNHPSSVILNNLKVFNLGKQANLSGWF